MGKDCLVYVLIKKNKAGVVLQEVVLSKADLDLILQGVYYAKIKDYYDVRKKEYGLVYSKIWHFVTGVKE